MVAESLIERLEWQLHPEHASFIQRTAPTQNEVLGIRMPELKRLLKPCITELTKAAPKQQWECIQFWADTEVLELKLAAFLALDGLKKLMDSSAVSQIINLNQNLDNWILIDYYGTLITGYAWRKGLLSFEDISSWMLHDNLWQRRLAITSCIGLDRGLKTNTESSPYIAEVALHLAHEAQPNIYKAISWMLRFHISRDRAFVVNFMKEFGSRFHNSVQREVMAKLDTGKKA